MNELIIDDISKFKQIELDDVKKLETGTKYYVYNPLSNRFKEEIANKKDIAHNKFVYKGLMFYLRRKDDE